LRPDKITVVEQEAQHKTATLESQLAALAKTQETMLQEKIALEEQLKEQSNTLSQQAAENQHLQARLNDKQQEVERLSQRVYQGR